MALLTRRSAVVVAAALAMAAPLAAAAPAAAETKLKMVLNWKYQGPQGCVFPRRRSRLLQSRRTRR